MRGVYYKFTVLMPRLGSGNLTMGIYAYPYCMLILILENNVFDEWDVIYLLLMNNVIVFIRLVLSEDLGNVNPRHERYMYMRDANYC